MPIYQVTTGFGKAKSGSPIQNNRSTVIMGGNTTAPESNSVSLESNLSQVPYYGSQLKAAVSPSSSGNTGAGTAVSTAPFGNGVHSIIDKVTTVIGGASNTLLQTGASDTSSRRPVNRAYANARYDVRAFDIYPKGSGKATLGSMAGTDVPVSGIDGTTGFYADTSIPKNFGIPARLTFMAGSIQPSGARYKVQTNP